MKFKKIIVLLIIVFVLAMAGCNFNPGQIASSANNTKNTGDASGESTEIEKTFDYSGTEEYLDKYMEFFQETIETINSDGWTKELISYLCSEANIYYNNIKSIDSDDVSSEYRTFHDNYLEHFKNIDQMEEYFLDDNSIKGINLLIEAINSIEDAYHSINKDFEIGEITINIRDVNDVAEAVAEKAAEEAAEEEVKEAEEEEKKEEEKPVPQGPSKNTYFANIRNIINEYDMLINHWNTYYQDYKDLGPLIEFGGSVQNKLGEINNMLKNITPASGYEGTQAHFIDIANNMYHYHQQEINCLKNRDIDGCNNMINNFNNTYNEFINYYNSL